MPMMIPGYRIDTGILKIQIRSRFYNIYNVYAMYGTEKIILTSDIDTM